MFDFIQNLNLDLNQYLPATIAWATNILLAIVILLLGLWFAKSVNRLIVGIGKKYLHLDDTLFRFLGSVARYVILAFVFIAVLNRFGVQTASIVALLGAAGLAVGLALQGAMSNLAAGVMLLIFRPYQVIHRNIYCLLTITGSIAFYILSSSIIYAKSDYSSSIYVVDELKGGR